MSLALERRHIIGAGGMAGVVLLWWLLAVTAFKQGGALATPPEVIRQMIDDGWEFYGPNISATVSEAGLGFLFGNVAAIACGIIVIIFPRLEGPAVLLALATYCMPIMAVGPVLALVTSGQTPMVALAALSVFFTTVVGTVLGLRSADPVALDLVRAYGGGRRHQLRKVQLRASLPALMSALKIAAPAAFLGAIIGEWLGATDKGLGVALVSSEQHLEVARTWGITLVCAAVPTAAYALVALAGRVLTPWAHEAAASSGLGPAQARGEKSLASGLGRAAALLLPLLAMVVIGGLVWVVFLRVANVSELVGKTPWQVWNYLVTADAAGANRSVIAQQLGITLRDAGLGFVVGIAGGSVMAVLFVLFAPLEQSLMSVAMFARTVPFAVLTPLIAMVVGRGLGAVAIVSGMIVFFPVLVNVAFGLRSASRETTDLVKAYGGSKWVELRKVALPSALPAFFAAVRLSVPAALVGGLVAEWEVTGDGLGYLMVSDVSSFNYTELWAAAVVITLVSLLIYGVVSAIEVVATNRLFGRAVGLVAPSDEALAAGA